MSGFWNLLLKIFVYLLLGLCSLVIILISDGYCLWVVVFSWVIGLAVVFNICWPCWGWQIAVWEFVVRIAFSLALLFKILIAVVFFCSMLCAVIGIFWYIARNGQKLHQLDKDRKNPATDTDNCNLCKTCYVPKEGQQKSKCRDCQTTWDGFRIWTVKSLLLSTIASASLYTAWQKGKCFTEYPIVGTVRMSLRHPTFENCNALHDDCASNFTDLVDLPYCNQYTGHTPEKRQLTCKIIDAFGLDYGQRNPGEIFIPTRIMKKHQKRKCTPRAPKFNCAKLFETFSTENFYVAEIERYTLMLDHGFATKYPDGSIQNSHRGNDMTGTLLVGDVRSNLEGIQHMVRSFVNSRRLVDEDTLDRLKILDKFKRDSEELDIPEGNAAKRLKELPSVRSIPSGDIISVRDLLTLAQRNNRELDSPFRENSSTTRRIEGGRLVVRIAYSNKGKFWIKDVPSYTIGAHLLKINEYKHEYVQREFGNEEDDREARSLNDVHGFQVTVEFAGELHSFDLESATVIAFLTVFIVAWTKYDEFFEKSAREILLTWKELQPPRFHEANNDAPNAAAGIHPIAQE